MGTAAVGSAALVVANSVSRGVVNTAGAIAAGNGKSVKRNFWINLIEWALVVCGTMWISFNHESLESGWWMLAGLLGWILSAAGLIFIPIALGLYADVKIAYRIARPVGPLWRMTLRNTSTNSLFLILLLPLKAVLVLYIWVYDIVRFALVAPLFILTLGKTRLATDEFFLYRKQAALYNAIKRTHGEDVADYLLYETCIGTDLPFSPRPSFEDFQAGLKHHIFAPKISKYGCLFEN